MSDKIYTTNTASLKATTADIRKLNAKHIEAVGIQLNGLNIEDKFGLLLPEDYHKLVKRCNIPEGSNYVLYDDNGNIVYISFADKLVYGNLLFERAGMTFFNYDLPALKDGSGMFRNCRNLKCVKLTAPLLVNAYLMFSTCTIKEADIYGIMDGSEMFKNCALLETVNGDLSKLESASSMFVGCYNLANFNSSLESLSYAPNMFLDSVLNSTSMDNILATLPRASSMQPIMLGIDSEAIPTIERITGKTVNTTGKTLISGYRNWALNITVNK